MLLLKPEIKSRRRDQVLVACQSSCTFYLNLTNIYIFKLFLPDNKSNQFFTLQTNQKKRQNINTSLSLGSLTDFQKRNEMKVFSILLKAAALQFLQRGSVFFF